MEQAAALTMSDKTAPPTRETTPSPKDKDKDTEKAPETPTASAGAAGETPATPTASTTAVPLSQRLYSGNLNEEVGQVMKGLGSFWGGFKAKSASTFTTLKSDLDKTVAQVQSDLKHLQETKVEVQTKDEETWKKEQAEEKERARVREEEEAARKAAEAASKAKGKGKARDLGEGEAEAEAGGEGEGAAASPTSPAATATATATALFNRLSLSTAQLQSSIQSTVASTVAAAKANPTLSNPAQLRSQIAENLRLQTARENISLSFQQAEKLAEEYLKKGEGYLKEVERVAEKWVEENVRVIPPNSADYVPSTGWDTGEWYAFSTVTPPATATAAEGPTTATPRASLSSAALAGSRKEALLRRLREDKDLLMVDPASEAETKERRDEFAAWVQDKWPAAKTAGREAEEGNVGTIRMALVPEHLTDEQFWQRYLFHKDMIEAADAKRKLLVQATQETTDDFSWDDDDDTEAPTAAPASGSASAHTTTTGSGTASATPTLAHTATVSGSVKDSAATSPRDSEESYDVVSRQASTAAATEDDDDSDWE